MGTGFGAGAHLDNATKDQEPRMMTDREPSPARSAVELAGRVQEV